MEYGKKYPYLIGDFMWTAWDYIGEAGIGAWSYTGGMAFNRPYPWLLAGAGVIDILGNPDMSSLYAKMVWGWKWSRYWCETGKSSRSQSFEINLERDECDNVVVVARM